MSFIEKLQNKPRHIRLQILWVSVILVMVIVIFIWSFSLKSSFGILENNQKNKEQKEQSIPSLFGTIKEDFSIMKNSLKANINSVLKINEEIEEFDVEIIKPTKLPE